MHKIKYKGMAMIFAFMVISCGIVQGARQPQRLNWASLDVSSNVVVHSELLVKFKRSNIAVNAYGVDTFSVTANAVNANIGATMKRRFKNIGWDQVSLPAGMSLEDAAKLYENNPDVEIVEPNYIIHIDAVPNDPMYSQLWGMERINAPQAWDFTTGSTNVVVAVIDTGINLTHEDLIDNLWTNPGESGLDGGGNDKRTNGIDDDGNGYIDDWRGWDFVNGDNDPTDGHGHGSHVSGTIGAVGNNDKGVVGVNWTVKIVGLKGLSDSGSGSSADLAAAIIYAANLKQYIKLTSNSWGGGGFSQFTKDAIANSDQLFVAAAGNDGVDNDKNPHYPSSYDLPNIISVASITSNGTLSSFSNYGRISVDIAAPGSDILSCWFNSTNAYNTISGTSMATPHVSGAAALLWAINPSATWQEVRNAILDEAVPNVNLAGKVTTGGELTCFLAITPRGDYYASGEPIVGPYLASNKVYTIKNFSATSQDWNVTVTSGWLTVSSSVVTVPAFGSSDVLVSVNQSAAMLLPEGKYSGDISFLNVALGASISRRASLRVGYNYKLSSAVYDWIDPISNGHARVSISGGLSTAKTIPFNFNYYYTNYSKLYIADSGIAGFTDSALNTYHNGDIPYPDEPNDILAPLWDDLTGGSIYIGTNGTATASNQQFIISWIDMTHADNPSVKYSFQAIIKEMTDIAETNDIVFQYQEVSQDVGTPGEGRSATIGVEDVDGLLGRIYSKDGSTLLANRQALLFAMTNVIDTTPPTAEITVLSHTFSTVSFDVRFSEIVTGFSTNDIVFTGSTAGVTSNNIIRVTGSGERYVVTLDFGDKLGAIWLGVRPGAVRDLAGLENEAVAAALYVIPLFETVYSDSMADGSNDWSVSSGNVGIYYLGGWEWGTPSGYGPDDGSNCWGTILSGLYSNNMNSWMESPMIHISDAAIIIFDLWYSLEERFDFGYVEVNAGMGWVNVTPNGFYTGDSAGWYPEQIELDPAIFANKDVNIRFRFTSDYSFTRDGIYIRNFAIKSVFDPGIWAHTVTPDNMNVNTSTGLTVVAYNMTTTIYHNVQGVLGSAAGVSINGDGNIVYGDMVQGAIVTGAVISVTAGTSDKFVSDTVELSHLISTEEGYWFNNVIALGIIGADAPPASIIIAKTDVGVVDWLDHFISGTGDDNSSLIQLVYAGPNGTNDPAGTNNPAGADGSTTGDDVVLYENSTLLPHGRFGAGGVVYDTGRFNVEFLHNLPAGALVYARAWDGSEYVTATAYGDSELRTVASGSIQTIDFGSWKVDTPANCKRDSNGDTVPDGWYVLFGGDPESGQPLLPTWTVSTNSVSMLLPEAVAVWSNFVFVADTRNNRIQIWDSNLSTNIGAVGSFGVGTNEFNWPAGLAVNKTTAQLVVADTGNDRIVVYNINTVNGSLTPAFTFGSTGSGYAQFNKPRGVALDAAGNIYVADQANNRIEVFNNAGVYLRSISDLSAQPVSVALDPGGNTYVVLGAISTVNVYNASGAFIDSFGTDGVGNGEFSNPFDIKIGEGGRVYVANTSNNRIEILGATNDYLVSYGVFGVGAGEFNYPQGICFSDAGELYIADTRNNRVQKMSRTLDADGDGMDDFWEDANGLDSSDPNDASADTDGDGLSNIGEYRVGTDPNIKDTNGNGIWDGAEVWMCADPLGLFYGVVIDNVWHGGLHSLSWNVDSGATYDVEMATDLITTNWILLDSLTVGFDGKFGWTNSVVEPGPLNYYRVIRKQ